MREKCRRKELQARANEACAARPRVCGEAMVVASRSWREFECGKTLDSTM